MTMHDVRGNTTMIGDRRSAREWQIPRAVRQNLSLLESLPHYSIT
jgi:hypothetical protein